MVSVHQCPAATVQMDEAADTSTDTNARENKSVASAHNHLVMAMPKVVKKIVWHVRMFGFTLQVMRGDYKLAEMVDAEGGGGEGITLKNASAPHETSGQNSTLDESGTLKVSCMAPKQQEQQPEQKTFRSMACFLTLMDILVYTFAFYTICNQYGRLQETTANSPSGPGLLHALAGLHFMGIILVLGCFCSLILLGIHEVHEEDHRFILACAEVKSARQERDRKWALENLKRDREWKLQELEIQNQKEERNRMWEMEDLQHALENSERYHIQAAEKSEIEWKRENKREDKVRRWKIEDQLWARVCNDRDKVWKEMDSKLEYEKEERNRMWRETDSKLELDKAERNRRWDMEDREWSKENEERDRLWGAVDYKYKWEKEERDHMWAVEDAEREEAGQERELYGTEEVEEW